MKARRTPWYDILLALLFGLIGGIGLAKINERSQVSLVGASVLVPIALAVLGVFSLWLAWQVHRYVKGKTKDFDPRRAYNTLVIAKSVTVIGALLVGWYGGQIVVVAPHSDAAYYKSALVECIVAGSAALFDFVAGEISERWCELPPADGPESPKNKKNNERQRRALVNPPVGSAAEKLAEKTAKKESASKNRTPSRH